MYNFLILEFVILKKIGDMVYLVFNYVINYYRDISVK